MRFCKRNKKGLIAIFACIKILLEMYLCSGIKIDNTFFIAFTEHKTFPLIEIYIFAIKFYKFPDTHSC